MTNYAELLFPFTLSNGAEVQQVFPMNAPSMFRAISHNRLYLAAHDPYFIGPETATPDAVIAGVARTLIEAEHGCNLTGGAFIGDQIIARVSAKFLPTPEYLRLGYWIIPEYRGHGLIVEIVGTIIRFALNECGVKMAWATPQVANTPSRRVAEKLGLTPNFDPPVALIGRTAHNEILYTLSAP